MVHRPHAAPTHRYGLASRPTAPRPPRRSYATAPSCPHTPGGSTVHDVTCGPGVSGGPTVAQATTGTRDSAYGPLRTPVGVLPKRPQLRLYRVRSVSERPVAV